MAFVSGSADVPAARDRPARRRAGAARRACGSERTAILTSATVPATLAGRVGLPAETTDQVDVGSPFDYPTTRCCTARCTCPDPKSPTVRGRGRTTSSSTDRRRRRAHAGAVHELGGDRPRRGRRRERRLRADPHPARPAQAGARQPPSPSDERRACSPPPGCSRVSTFPADAVAGRHRQAAVPAPDDPLLSARRELLGAAAFDEIDVPRAATMLAQASGRLDPHRDRPRCRRRARPAARHGALPLGHRQGIAADASHPRPRRGRGVPARDHCRAAESPVRSTPMGDLVRVERQGGIATITLDSQHNRNALSRQLAARAQRRARRSPRRRV